MFSSNTSQVSNDANYIEDVFSTYLYTGTDTTSTGVLSINNGIDLAGKGGLVWIKSRSGATSNALFDTTRGTNKLLTSNSTAAQTDESPYTLGAFNANGFSLGSASLGSYALVNGLGGTYASWTFRKQPKFFDVVTYTGNGTNGRTVAHSLGSTPGCIIVKRTDAANGWAVYHRSMNASPQDYMMRLNATDAAFTTSPSRWNNTLPTSTEFTLSGNDEVNGSGGTYVAYLFAHNAGGFGLTGTDNVISCGSFTTDSGGNFSEVNLGYEPQWLLIKNATTALGFTDWRIVDNMRGFTTSTDTYLAPNTSAAEGTAGIARPTATGFAQDSSSNIREDTTYIYIAIRRGPMKVPTDATKVFRPNPYRAGLGVAFDRTSSSFPLNDLVITKAVDSATQLWAWTDRLRGATKELNSAATTAETTYANDITSFAYNNGFRLGSGASGNMNDASATYEDYMFRRAPSFFDEVCYTGTGSATTFSHNLGVAPELMIVKRRDTVEDWNVYNATIGNTAYLRLNTTAASATAGGDALWGSTTPTSSVFTVKTSAGTNASAGTFVAYLFATCAGVSKVGSYTGTATTKQIDCGFTAGARFVLIKKTSGTGSWYVWDSARGIVSGNDPYLLLNSTAAEVTNTDYIDTYSAGFEISSTAPSEINENGGSFIFFAVA